MKRKLMHLILTAGLSTTLASLALNAQSSRETADIPFAFHAQGKVLPAGHYTFAQTNVGSPGIIKVARQSGQSLFVNASVPKDSGSGKPSVGFVCYGNECVLAKVVFQGSDRSLNVPQSAVERELTHKIGIASMIQIPLKSR
jgi:hypothetical protein